MPHDFDDPLKDVSEQIGEPPKKKRRQPVVAEFGAGLLQVYIKGAVDPVTITFDEKNDAIEFRRRMNQLRQALIREEHDAAGVAQRCTNYMREEDGKFIIVCAPSDARFEEALKNAGIKISD